MSKGIAVVLAEDQHEVLELHYPRIRLEEAGYDVKVLGPKDEKQKFVSKEGYWAFTDGSFESVDAKEVKVLVVPGGLLCPDRLRRYKSCLDLIANVKEAGGVLGFICHGPWVGISAKVLKGVKATCFFAIKDDIINAGAEYSEDLVVVDEKHKMYDYRSLYWQFTIRVTAQSPKECAAFMKAILEILEK